MKSFEFSGKNIEKAIENGLKELNKNREDVDIKILSEGGLFSKAKVQISFEEETDEKIAQDIVKDELLSGCDCGCENCHHNSEEECDCGCEECKCTENCSEECDCGHKECAETKNCECENCEDEFSCINCGDQILAKDLEGNEQVENSKKAREYMSSEEVFDKINEIFKNIFEALKINGKVMILENDDAYEVKVSGDENISSLIGYRGEALNAYQVLINSFVELKNKSKRILLDVENYRTRREESLKNLAERIAKKVVKTKRSHKFEPMSSFERHVIHEALSGFDGVSTHSEGIEPHRCLIVEPTNKKEN